MIQPSDDRLSQLHRENAIAYHLYMAWAKVDGIRQKQIKAAMNEAERAAVKTMLEELK